MARTTTTYELLLSCPGDVYEECFPVVKDTVAEFNQMYGNLYNVGITLTHWTTDSYPQSGGHPQKLLNTQIVDSADAAIAIFWTRFGTPTEEYGSGTEEEIEKMLSADRQVFLYFLDKPVPPSILADPKSRSEFDKIQELKRRYQNRGIYWFVHDAQDLKQKLTIHLVKHFLSAIEAVSGNVTVAKSPNLFLAGKDGNNKVFVEHFALSGAKFLSDKRDLLVTTINEAMSNKQLPRSSATDEQLVNKMPLHTAGNLLGKANITDIIPAHVSSDSRELIEAFCTNENIVLPENFWDLGDLNRKSFRVSSLWGGYADDGLVGEEADKERYRLLERISLDILDYNDYKDFFHKVDSIPFVELLIANNGTTFDQEVVVKLFFPCGTLFPMNTFPMPEYIDEDFLETHLIDGILCQVADSDLLEYNDYPNGHFLGTSIDVPRINESAHDQFRRHQSDYRTRIEQLFFCDVFQEKGKDILRVRFGEVRQHTKVLFPTKLFLSNTPQTIEYTITGKYTPTIISGTIELV